MLPSCFQNVLFKVVIKYLIDKNMYTLGLKGFGRHHSENNRKRFVIKT